MEPNAWEERLPSVHHAAGVTPHPLHLDEFDHLYRESYRRLVLVAYATTGSLALAEELVQDAFLQLLRRWDKVEAKEAWLRRAVVSLATSWLRRQIIERRIKASARDDGDATASINLRLLLAGLSGRQRAAVVLRFYNGLSERDIAIALRCRPGTVKSLISRSLAKLREELRHADRS